MKRSRMFLGAGLLAAAGLFAVPAAFAQAPANDKPAETKADQPKSEPKPDAKPEEKPVNPTPPTPATEEKLVYVKFETTKGDIVFELDNEKAPISTKNFLSYVDKKFYDGTIFHRVIPNFVIQGGGHTQDLALKPTDAPIKNEWKNGLKNKRGTISMARLPMPDSATSQFFINVRDNEALDAPNGGAAYAVFGKVVVGMDVVDKIRMVKTGNKGGMADVPLEPISVNAATRLSAEDAKKLMQPGSTPAEPVKKN